MASSTSDPHDSSPAPGERTVDSIAAQVDGIDAILALARSTVRVFDIDLAHMGWNTPARSHTLGGFLRRPEARLQLIVHDTRYLERACARLCNLLLRHAATFEIRRTGAAARRAMDPLMIVDDRHFVHRFHIDHARAVIAIDQPASARPLIERFDEIWESGEPGVQATVLGL